MWVQCYYLLQVFESLDPFFLSCHFTYVAFTHFYFLGLHIKAVIY